MNSNHYPKHSAFDGHYYYTNKKAYNDTPILVPLTPYKRSQSYNNNGADIYANIQTNSSPFSTDQDHPVFTRNNPTHSTLPPKYFGEGTKKEKRVPQHTGIRFAPTTELIDVNGVKKSPPLNGSGQENLQPIYKSIYKNNPKPPPNIQNNPISFKPIIHHNSITQNNTNTHNIHQNSPNIDATPFTTTTLPQRAHHHQSPRSLLRYIWLEPLVNNQSGVTNQFHYLPHSSPYELRKKGGDNNKQYRIHFCCLSFRWPPWRIETIDEKGEVKPNIDPSIPSHRRNHHYPSSHHI
uniref:Uncharacterized protein n=1 Tax=Rhabditophanes sp. KR3021 TaxID=114890 RepID=A0AC35U955_9BILA